jgi:TetR/AcrR family transcriptional regulator, transcriptional repressor for nem operon
MRYTAEHKEHTRRRILAEAAGAIRARGPERMGVAEVMNGLGLTHGGFYAHFKSKDELVAQAIAYMFDETYAWFQARTEGLEPGPALAAFIGIYLSRSHRDARATGCAVAAMCGDLPRLPRPARASFTQGLERLQAGLAGLLRKLGRRNAEALALSAIAEMSGALALARAVGESERSDLILRTAREQLRERLGLETVS